MSPAYLAVLLHCHYVGEPIKQDTPVVKEALAYFLREDLIELDREKPLVYTTTARGNAFVGLLTETPLPILVWVDPRKKCCTERR